ncbi:hypothetical protein K488DRAFT_73516 [Vararia minispora EC-137]|uniref:Uncharacterized protein n=1 Tax=Vararia minispora EC-137 TaxID=1314806 RepID=A0ACB8QAY4_9AGAM|nr:hypothetical protein K488DRAFT_73516 [Vararia minispora EC-137]
MLYLQSFIRTPDVPRLRAPSLLSDKTNAPSFRPRRIESKKVLGLRVTKAAATVALTPASTCAQVDVLQSFVPFPSSDEDEEDEGDTLPPSSSSTHVENGLKRPLPTETRRKRCQVLPAESCHGAAPRRRSVPLASPKPRPAAASPPIIVPSSKRPKKSRRAVADMQFAADVHRSILRGLRAHEDVAMAVDGFADVLREQDRELADRLSRGLRDQGCSPVLIEGCAHHAPPSVEVTKIEIGIPLPEGDVVMDGVIVAGRAAGAAQLAPPSIRTSSPPHSPPAHAPRSPSPPPTTVVSAPGSRVYEIPQLVAALHMRRQERAAKTRPQSLLMRPRVRTPSPLAAPVVVSADVSES